MNWDIVDNKLERIFEFENQTKAAMFILLIAKHSDRIQHHADYQLINYNTVVVNILTHDAKAITEKDSDLAMYIDAQFETFY